jgi:RNA polymerase sigma factor (sigma-70 family)
MMALAGGLSGLLASTRNVVTSDAELLGRFVAERDGSAFAALVARHGSMVLGVCRRVIHDWQLAEDAYQATFLVLARRAVTISPPGAVAGWLHGVAYRVAKNARRTHLRRIGRERPTDEVPELATPDVLDSDLRDVIDGEVQRLPGKYRDLIVACDLEERDRRSVAAAVGIPEGTLSSRLTAARKMLAGRLAKRGVAAASVAVVALDGPRLVACEVPRRLLASAAKLGCGKTGSVPVGVSSLASKASQNVIYQALVPVTLLLLSACGVLCVTFTAGGPPPTPQPTVVTASAAVRTAEPKPNPLPERNKLLFRHGPQLMLIDPDGKNEKALPGGELTDQQCDFWFSPDGDRLAVINGPLDPETKKSTRRLYVRKTDDAKTVTDLGVMCKSLAWSPDGTQLACSDFEDGGLLPNLVVSSFLIDIATKKKTPLKLPNNHIIVDWSRDGTYFLTCSFKPNFLGVMTRLHLMNLDGTEHKALSVEKQIGGIAKFSPDGKRVLYDTSSVLKESDPAKFAILDLATGKSTMVEGHPTKGPCLSVCWSPNGKQFAYLCYERDEGKRKLEEKDTKEYSLFVVVYDADGKNPKTVANAKAMGALLPISGLDWR